MKLKLKRIDDGELVDVEVPDVITIREEYETGWRNGVRIAGFMRVEHPSSDHEALHKRAFQHGYCPPEEGE